MSDMTNAEVQLSLIYTKAFKNKTQWTPEDHLAGLKAVWNSGVDVGRKVAHDNED